MTLERVLVVLVVIGLAVLLAVIQNRGVAVSRRSRSFEGLPSGIAVFASRSCQTCDTVEAIVADAAGARDHRVYWWDETPDVFEQNDIDRVPAIALVNSDGSGWIAVGVPTVSRLRRWLGGP